MKTRTLFTIATLLAVTFLVRCSTDNLASDAPVKAAQAKIERGRYLVSIAGCHDCHTPWKMTELGPEPDMTRALSGHPEGMTHAAPALRGPWVSAGNATNTAFAGPWGVSYAANLTSDSETGIGFMDEATFVRTIRSGKHLGAGRPILPPMPWPVYRNMTDQDLGAVFAYLMSTTPIKNKVPAPQLATH